MICQGNNMAISIVPFGSFSKGKAYIMDQSGDPACVLDTTVHDSYTNLSKTIQFESCGNPVVKETEVKLYLTDFC